MRSGYPGKASDALRNLLAAQGFEQRRQEVAEGQHHQGEAGILLAEASSPPSCSA